MTFSAIKFPSHSIQKDLCFNNLKTPQCSDPILSKLVTQRFGERNIILRGHYTDSIQWELRK